MNIKAVAAELLGSFLFFFLGYLSVAAFQASNVPVSGLVVVPFAFGFGLLTAIYAFGHISGGHYNPAVTVAMVLDKRTTPVDAVGYIVAQILGAVVAGAVVMVAVSQKAVASGVTRPNTAAGITDIGALVMEVVATAGFLVVILTATKKAPAIAGLVIPLTLVAIHFAIATLSGASVNPARSLGSAIIGQDFTSVWVYIVGPVVGGILGWLVFKAMNSEADAA